MEALGVCANIAGLAVIVGHLTRRVTEDFEGIKNAPSILKSIKGHLSSLSSLLAAIEPISENNLKEKLTEQLQAALTEALARCAETCKTFEVYLQRFTKNNPSSRISPWIRIRIGFLEIKKIDSFTRELEACKHTLSLALAATSLTMSMKYSETNLHDTALVLKKEAPFSQGYIEEKKNEPKHLLTPERLPAAPFMTADLECFQDSKKSTAPNTPSTSSNSKSAPETTTNTRQTNAEAALSSLSGLTQKFAKITVKGSQHLTLGVKITEGASLGNVDCNQDFGDLEVENNEEVVVGTYQAPVVEPVK